MPHTVTGMQMRDITSVYHNIAAIVFRSLRISIVMRGDAGMQHMRLFHAVMGKNKVGMKVGI